MAVQVRTLKIEGRREVRHRADMTVAQVLGEAKVVVPAGGAVMVYRMDGRNVSGERLVPLDQLATVVVADNEYVVVTPPVANG